MTTPAEKGVHMSASDDIRDVQAETGSATEPEESPPTADRRTDPASGAANAAEPLLTEPACPGPGCPVALEDDTCSDEVAHGRQLVDPAMLDGSILDAGAAMAGLMPVESPELERRSRPAAADECPRCGDGR